jgi:uroporphyrinogen-III synthase
VKDRKKILVTGSLEDALANRLAEYHEVDVVPFINIEPIVSEKLKEELEELSNKELHVVFTSNNGVKSVAALIAQKPEHWKMFCIEGVTSKSIEEHFGADSLEGTALSSEVLAKEILNNSNVKEVVFFCGDLRRDDLPELLRGRGIKVKEVIVYNTIATPVKVEKEYDAIVFFSPSAVYSYVAMNRIHEKTECFAIGNTTANTIKNIVSNKVMIAQPPQKERVLEMVLEYYN